MSFLPGSCEKKGEGFVVVVWMFPPAKNLFFAGLLTELFLIHLLGGLPVFPIPTPYDERTVLWYQRYVQGTPKLAACFFWRKVFTSLNPLVVGAGSCTSDLLLFASTLFAAQPAGTALQRTLCRDASRPPPFTSPALHSQHRDSRSSLSSLPNGPNESRK
jgi:hypothetical protein